ncbi:hypothetical protein PybrP1_003839 [[Pythium] brassicae (nom. inval.)]|nr:hypothetical protein PybrP1_003839 [[Pythium] brassicae (nom. inval.)]
MGVIRLCVQGSCARSGAEVLAYYGVSHRSALSDGLILFSIALHVSIASLAVHPETETESRRACCTSTSVHIPMHLNSMAFIRCGKKGVLGLPWQLLARDSVWW